jgi:phospholipid/cholesterol/gamma-HCH transport system permease protein
MSIDARIEAAVLYPLGWFGRCALGMFAYLGGISTLLLSAAQSIVRPHGDDPPLFAAIRNALATDLALGLPLVALVHVGMGSFLSMQAYFGGTFVDGTGAVVGVGLIRNVAPLMTGLTLAGFFAARIAPGLRRRIHRPETAAGARPESSARATTRPEVDTGYHQVFAREVGRALAPDGDYRAPRLVAVRLASAMITALILTPWAIAVGTLVGWQVAKSLLGVSTDAFFTMFMEMLWVRDVVGLVVKSTLFGFFAALFACYEGAQRSAGAVTGDGAAAACRAACFAAIAMMAGNSGWFILLYHAGPAFGPTLLAPPAP